MTTLEFTSNRGARIGSTPVAVGLGCLVVLAAALRIPTLGEQSYWFDEGRTIWVIHTSFTGMLHHDYRGQTTPELYYILAWAWSQIVGYGEFGVRLVSAVAGIATVPVAFLIGRKLSDQRAGLIAAALTACSPMLIWYSQEARAYSLMVLLSSVALLAFVSLLDEPESRWVAVWALAAGLSLSTHYYAAIAVVPQGVWLVLRYRNRRRVWVGAAVVAFWGAALVPQEISQARFFPGGGGWIASVPLGTRLPVVLIQQLLGPSRILTPITLTIDLAVVGLAALAICRNRLAARDSAPALILTLCGAAIFGLSIVTGHDLLDPRNVLAIWMPLMVTIAIGLSSYWPSRLGLVAALAICTVGVVTVLAVNLTARLQRPAWRSVARAIDRAPTQAVFAVYGCKTRPLELYLPVAQHHSPTTVSSLTVITTPPQPTRYDVLIKNWYSVCSQSGSPVHLPRELSGLTRTGRAETFGQFTVQRYTSRTPQPLSTATLAQAGLNGLLMKVRGHTTPLLGPKPRFR